LTTDSFLEKSSLKDRKRIWEKGMRGTEGKGERAHTAMLPVLGLYCNATDRDAATITCRTATAACGETGHFWAILVMGDMGGTERETERSIAMLETVTLQQQRGRNRVCWSFRITVRTKTLLESSRDRTSLLKASGYQPQLTQMVENQEVL